MTVPMMSQYAPGLSRSLEPLGGRILAGDLRHLVGIQSTSPTHAPVSPGAGTAHFSPDLGRKQKLFEDKQLHAVLSKSFGFTLWAFCLLEHRTGNLGHPTSSLRTAWVMWKTSKDMPMRVLPLLMARRHCCARASASAQLRDERVELGCDSLHFQGIPLWVQLHCWLQSFTDSQRTLPSDILRHSQ